MALRCCCCMATVIAAEPCCRWRSSSRQGCSVLPISLRAHGDSTGAVNDIGYGARRDVMAAIDYLERRCAGRPILIHGTSLGAAAAIYAAGTLEMRVFGYILESPFTDLRTAIRNRTENYLPFPLDRIGYAGMALTGPFVLTDLDRMAPLAAIGAIPTSVPVVLLAGGRDRESRPDEARAFYEQIRAMPGWCGSRRPGTNRVISTTLLSTGKPSAAC